MGVSTTTLTDVTLSAHGADRTAVARSVALGGRLLARCGAWVRLRNDTARLRDMEPHLARDIGVSPARGDCPEGFAADPRPLWGIGLTPLPTSATPPWFGERRGG